VAPADAGLRQDGHVVTVCAYVVADGPRGGCDRGHSPARPPIRGRWTRALRDVALRDVALRDVALRDAALRDAARRDAALRGGVGPRRTPEAPVGAVLVEDDP
jgi:hypothetical protein